MPVCDSTKPQSSCDNLPVFDDGNSMPRNSRKAHNSSEPANCIWTEDSTDTITYCSGLPSSVATILDAAFNKLCFRSASRDLLVVIFKYGMVAPILFPICYAGHVVDPVLAGSCL